ncbi:TOM (translocase of outer membrane) complex component, partial [Massospora cicadina]
DPASESSPLLQRYLTLTEIDAAKLVPENEGAGGDIEKAQGGGQRQFRKNHFGEAIKYYSKGIDIKPHAVLYCNRAACHANLQSYQATIEDCNAALALNKQYIKAYIRRGQAYEKLSRLSEALDGLGKDYTAAHILSESRNQVASSSAERVLSNIASAEARQLFKLKNKAVGLPSKSDLETFMLPYEFDLIAESTRSSPGDEAYIKANNFMVHKNYPEAYRWVEIALKEGTSFECDALLLRALFKLASGKADEANEDADKALALRPLDPIPYIIRATHLLEQNRPQEALECLCEAKGMNPESFAVRYHLGQFQLALDNLTEATKSYKECIALRPNAVMAYIQLGVVQFRMDDIQSAERTYRDLIDAFPKSPEAHTYYAELLVAVGRNDEAMSCLDEALRCDPNFVLALANLAILNLQYTKDFSRAEAFCMKALEDLPRPEKNREAITALQRCIDYSRSEKEIEAAVSYREAVLAQMRFDEAHPELEPMAGLTI